MIHFLQQFFFMGGYAIYVWPAYIIFFLALIIQWFFPWRRWHRYLREQKNQLDA